MADVCLNLQSSSISRVWSLGWEGHRNLLVLVIFVSFELESGVFQVTEILFDLDKGKLSNNHYVVELLGQGRLEWGDIGPGSHSRGGYL